MAELGILDGIQAHFRSDVLDTVMPWITRLGDSGLVWILLGLGLVVFARRERSLGGQVLLGLIFSLILCNLLLKNGVGRVRPCDLNPALALLIPRPEDPSFPSGHTSASFAAVTVLFLRRWKGRWAALVLALLIAFSRLYLYVHFPTDVLGGLATGVLSGWLAVTLWQRWAARRGASRSETR